MSAVLAKVLRADKTPGRHWESLGAAIVLEVALVAGVLAWMAMRPPTLPEQVIPLIIEAVVPAELKKPLEPQKPVLPPPQLQRSRPILPATPPPQLTPVPTPLPLAQAAAPVQAAPVPMTQVVAAPSPAPMPVQRAVPVPAIDAIPAYNAKLTAAAQAAFEVPGSVTALNFKGRARVGFKLRDGLASSIAIVQSSGLGAMDRAATQAVQTAAFPQPPQSLQGQELSYEIWVTHTSAN